MPTIPDAEMIGDDTLCMTCHEPYLARFGRHIMSIASRAANRVTDRQAST